MDEPGAAARIEAKLHHGAGDHHDHAKNGNAGYAQAVEFAAKRGEFEKIHKPNCSKNCLLEVEWGE